MDTVKKLVRVTADDLKEGKPCDIRACPINRAVERLLAPGWRAQTGNYSVSFYNQPVPELGSAYAEHHSENPKAQGKVRAIDLGWPVQPFAFYLDIPKEALK